MLWDEGKADEMREKEMFWDEITGEWDEGAFESTHDQQPCSIISVCQCKSSVVNYIFKHKRAREICVCLCVCVVCTREENSNTRVRAKGGGRSQGKGVWQGTERQKIILRNQNLLWEWFIFIPREHCKMTSMSSQNDRCNCFWVERSVGTCHSLAQHVQNNHIISPVSHPPLKCSSTLCLLEHCIEYMFKFTMKAIRSFKSIQP